MLRGDQWCNTHHLLDMYSSSLGSVAVEERGWWGRRRDEERKRWVWREEGGEEGNIASPLKRSQSNFLHFGLATCWRSC